MEDIIDLLLKLQDDPDGFEPIFADCFKLLRCMAVKNPVFIYFIYLYFFSQKNKNKNKNKIYSFSKGNYMIELNFFWDYLVQLMNSLIHLQL